MSLLITISRTSPFIRINKKTDIESRLELVEKSLEINLASVVALSVVSVGIASALYKQNDTMKHGFICNAIRLKEGGYSSLTDDARIAVNLICSDINYGEVRK